MYKITLYNLNCSPVCDGTVNFFTEDIEDFQERWFKKNISDDKKDAFLRSKAGEIVTDWYSDSPEYNIVQYDEDAVVYGEKTVNLEDVTFDVHNAYGCTEKYHVNHWTIHFKWIRFGKEYFRIASYKADGVCMYYDWIDRWEDVTCWGNEIIDNKVIFEPVYPIREKDKWPNPGFDDFEENCLETICYITNRYLKNEQDLKEDMDRFEVTDEVMDWLFRDVIGEAG